jgi:DNA-binding CsgD family transcriptional regulator
MKSLPIPLRELLQRIEAKTVKTVSCWLWQGWLSEQKYPTLGIVVRGKHYDVRVRKILFESVNGPIPSQYSIRMSCSVERCICVEHMKVVRQGSWVSKHHLDEYRAPSVYPDALVVKIVDEFLSGASIRVLAEQYSLQRRLIAYWVRGNYRREITGMAKHPVAMEISHGEDCTSTKLTWQEVLIAVGLVRRGYSYRAVGKAFRVSAGNIRLICLGNSWGWLTDGLRVTSGRLYQREQVAEMLATRHASLLVQEQTVLQEFARGLSLIEIGQMTGYAFNTIRHYMKTGYKKLQLKSISKDEALVFQHWQGGRASG